MAKEFKKAENVIYVCNGPKCKKRGGKELRKFFKKLAGEEKSSKIEVIKTGCTDRCKFAPVVCFQPENVWFPYMNAEKGEEEFKKYYSASSSQIP